MDFGPRSAEGTQALNPVYQLRSIPKADAEGSGSEDILFGPRRVAFRRSPAA